MCIIVHIKPLLLCCLVHLKIPAEKFPVCGSRSQQSAEAHFVTRLIITLHQTRAGQGERNGNRRKLWFISGYQTHCDLYLDIRHTVIYIWISDTLRFYPDIKPTKICIWISDTLRLKSGYIIHWDLYLDIRHIEIGIWISDTFRFIYWYQTPSDLYPDIRQTDI